ncbi:MAG: hypothetical protein NC548_40520 [Lachnospiraceae bacterium]|nr:hypothetical protein [Lachnospiraceae bacterium]
MDNTKEYIMCSAIKRITPREETQLRNNEIHTVELGFRHCDIFHRFRGELLHDPDAQGFYTSHGRYVTRKEGEIIARNCGQLTKPLIGGELTSEDLW